VRWNSTNSYTLLYPFYPYPIAAIRSLLLRKGEGGKGINGEGEGGRRGEERGRRGGEGKEGGPCPQMPPNCTLNDAPG